MSASASAFAAGRSCCVALALLALVGCADGPAGAPGKDGAPGQPGERGPAGPPGPPGQGFVPIDGGGSTGPSCTPATDFCEAGRLWTCTRSGFDATGGTNCAADARATATNPYVCTTTGCPFGAVACCRATLKTCTWSFTSPDAVTGDQYAFAGTPTYCTPPEPCGSGGALAVQLSRTVNACPLDYYSLRVSVRRPFSAGQAITLPQAGVDLYVSNLDPTKSCFAWTGTVTPMSDVPNYSISVNATCSDAGKSAVRVVGTFSGSL